VQILSISFFEKLDAAKMQAQDSIVYSRYLKMKKDYYSLIDTSDIWTFNKTETINITRQIFNEDENVIMDIANRYITDTTLVNWFNNELAF
jgi:capsule polysaccharide export protein KpsE/RkpR